MAILATIGVRLPEILFAVGVIGAVLALSLGALEYLKTQLPSGRSAFHETT
ncbi:MAG TPA: hypothetical protein VN684_10690 [Terriglobales bacterium]|nr:hypothetical protein [Terriglobales bacterium]